MSKKIFNKFDKSQLIKASVWLLRLLLVFLILYLLVLPFYPEIKYRLSANKNQNYQDIEFVAQEANRPLKQLAPTDNFQEELPATDSQPPDKNKENGSTRLNGPAPAVKTDNTSRYRNRLIISKIGVNSPIIVTENEAYGLSLGSWLVPSSSRPNLGGNTIITGHRFRYLPPNNLTLYLLHKLELDDIFLVVWEGQDYYYRVREIKIVDPTDVSPNQESSEAILTIYTCHPIYSTAKRLVVISDLIVR